MENKTAPKLIDTDSLVRAPWQRGLFRLIKPAIEGLFGVDTVNKHYREVAGIADPVEFAEAVYRQLGIRYTLQEADLERLRKVTGPLVLVANQPFGGLEALLLLLLMRRVRPEFKLMAAEALANIPELKGSFIFVDPVAAEGNRRSNYSGLRASVQHLRAGGLLGVFPSGGVASFNPKTFRIEEPAWNSQVARLIQLTQAAVVPVYFHGHNSALFQTASLINPRLRNTLLIRELASGHIRALDFQVGGIITPHKLEEYQDPVELTAYLRSKTYLLGERYEEPKLRFAQIKPQESRGLPQQEPVIDPVPVAELEAEIGALPPDQKLFTAKEVEVYVCTAQQAPGLLRELGRLREITFRGVGEGTGKSLDVDQFDQWYDHIFLWHTENREIAGAYRIARCDEVMRTRGQEGLYINTLFHIQPSLYTQINPALELGRSFVAERYQKAYWSLLLLWTGIGQYIVRRPHYHGLIGPVSITGEFHTTSKDLLVKFLVENKLNTLIRDLVKPKHPYNVAKARGVELFNSFSIRDLNDVQDLIDAIETSDLKVPILLKHYLKMAGSILAFNVDPDFSNVLDALMYIDLRQTKTQTLKKYMTNEGYEVFRAQHNLGQVD